MGPKLLPGWLWGTLGRLLREPLRRPPGATLGRPGAPKKIVVRDLGASLGEKLIVFRAWGPGGIPGCDFGGAFLRQGLATRKKRETTKQIFIFGCLFWVAFLNMFLRLAGGAGGREDLENHENPLVFVGRNACARFSRARRRRRIFKQNPCRKAYSCRA